MFSCSFCYRKVADSALNNAVCWWTSVQKQRLRTGHSSLKQASKLPRAFFQQEPGTPSRAEHGKVEQTNRRPQRRSGLLFLRGALAANVEVTDTVPLRLSHAVCALTWRSRPRVSQNFRDLFEIFFRFFVSRVLDWKHEIHEIFMENMDSILWRKDVAPPPILWLLDNKSHWWRRELSVLNIMWPDRKSVV